MYISLFLSLSLYIYICICIYIFICIEIYQCYASIIHNNNNINYYDHYIVNNVIQYNYIVLL